MTEVLNQKQLVFRNWKTKTIASACAVVAAVVLPQIFHLMGMVTNMGTALGETYLPMHLAIFAVGLLAGPMAGLVAGLLSPVISFFLTAMPTSVMLPYMVVELGVYGVSAGLLAKVKMPTIVKLIIAQIAGRAVRAAATMAGIHIFGSAINAAVIWNSITAGLPGLVLQWALIPLLVFYIEKKAKYEDA